MKDAPVMAVEHSRLLARVREDVRVRVLERAALIRDGGGLDENGEPRIPWIEADRLALIAEGLTKTAVPVGELDQ